MSHKITHYQNKGVFIRITIHRSTRYIKLPVDIDSIHWSEETCRAKQTFKQYKTFNQYIDDIGERLDEGMIHCYSQQFTADIAKDYISDKLFNTKKQNTLRGFSQVMVDEFLMQKKPKNAAWINTAINQYLNALGKEDIHINQVSYSNLLEFRNKIQYRTPGKQVKQCKPNTINNYLRAIRNVYNSAVKRGVFVPKGKGPFEHSDLIPSIVKSPTRNITQSDITKLEQTVFTTAQQQAVDFWLLGYYLQGADFIDIANLTPANVFNGYIRFTRSKTNQPVCVKVVPKIQGLLDKYSGRSEKFLLPILHKRITNQSELKAYEQRRKLQNQHTKKAAKYAGVDYDITTKWLRHSWITIAKKLYVDESIRKQAVGHRNLNGSHAHYADDFDQHIIDAANALVLGYITIEQYMGIIYSSQYNPAPLQKINICM